MEVEAASNLVSSALQLVMERFSQGKYNYYTPQQRAKIGKYAAENDPMRAAKHFTVIWGIHMNEFYSEKDKVRILENVERSSVRGEVYSRKGVNVLT